MTSEPNISLVLVDRRTAGLNVVARAALEMTASCYVWLERSAEGLKVTMEEKVPGQIDIQSRFNAELERLVKQDRHDRKTRLIRSAVVGHALAKTYRPNPEPQQLSVLDPETEAEIEKLLAEIESDDWLEEASEIAKTWEERFGVGEKGEKSSECKEEKS